MVRAVGIAVGLGLAMAVACATDSGDTGPGAGGAAGGLGGAAGSDASSGGTAAGGSGGSTSSGGGVNIDANFDVSADAPFDPDAACATATEQAKPEFLPVDIIWAVDNSVSMQPAIDEVTKGLNAFAALIGTKNLDYRVIMLSLRSKTNPVVVAGSNRYAVCIPPPLAGDANCGNGATFFQSSIDIRSTQPLEQILGTLGQTAGYTQTDEKGGEPWKQWLRPEATKTFVVVTDDNARLSATDFETFAGGKNPFNSLTLPPGILDPSWGGLFTGYLFSALYGWGSATDPNVKCTYPGGATPPSSGPTYTELVTKTGGVRAQICAGSGAWGPFFDSVATAVSKNTKLSCQLDLPVPKSGTLDPSKVNVAVVGGGQTIQLLKVSGAAACDQSGGWYYDDDQNPTKVILCPASCSMAEQAGLAAGDVQISVLFGCSTIVK